MKNLSRILMASLVLFILGSLVAGTSLLLPWWGINKQVTDDGDTKTTSECITLFNADYYNYGGASIYNFSSMAGTVGLVALIAMLIGFVLSVVISVLSLQRALNRDPFSGNMEILTGLVLVMLIGAPIIFAVTYPMGLKDDLRQDHYELGVDYVEPGYDDWTEDFGGGYTNPSNGRIKTYEWGPDTGWFLSFFSAIFFAAGYIVSRFHRNPLPAGRTEPLRGRTRRDNCSIDARSPEDGHKRQTAGYRQRAGKADLDGLSDEELEEMLNKIRGRK